MYRSPLSLIIVGPLPYITFPRGDVTTPSGRWCEVMSRGGGWSTKKLNDTLPSRGSLHHQVNLPEGRYITRWTFPRVVTSPGDMCRSLFSLTIPPPGHHFTSPSRGGVVTSPLGKAMWGEGLGEWLTKKSERHIIRHVQLICWSTFTLARNEWQDWPVISLAGNFLNGNILAGHYVTAIWAPSCDLDRMHHFMLSTGEQEEKF